MWLFKDKELQEEDIPDEAIGFIYIIKNDNNKKYIGRKLLTKASYKMVKGKKKKVRKVSDWKNYWSSSPEILKDIESGLLFTREIILFCNNLSQLNYSEEKLQYSLGVLESENWYNSNIRAKVFKKNILNKVIDYTELIEYIKK